MNYSGHSQCFIRPFAAKEHFLHNFKQENVKRYKNKCEIKLKEYNESTFNYNKILSR